MDCSDYSRLDSLKLKGKKKNQDDGKLTDIYLDLNIIDTCNKRIHASGRDLVQKLLNVTNLSPMLVSLWGGCVSCLYFWALQCSQQGVGGDMFGTMHCF